MKINKLLFIGGVLSAIVSLLHVAVIIGGPKWYRFFGAGESFVQLAEQNSTYPNIITGTISVILMALSGYGTTDSAKAGSRIPRYYTCIFKYASKKISPKVIY